MVENSFYSPRELKKTYDRIDTLKSEIEALQNQIDDTFENSTDGYDTIRALQDIRRVKKKHTPSKSRSQINRESTLREAISVKQAEIAQLEADVDITFGEKVTTNLIEANEKEYQKQSQDLYSAEKNQYLQILDDFSESSFDKARKTEYINQTFEQTEFPSISVSNQYYEDSPVMYSSGEQDLAQQMVTETINIHGFSVRYLPRACDYPDEVWLEEPESYFHKGFMVDMMLVAADGFAGEGHVMSQYGLEYKEELELAVSMDRFLQLDSEYELTLVDSEVTKFARKEPLEGDLIIIPFGRGANNSNNYIPKVFQINYVTTYTDGVFFQLGELYQHRIKASLYELSAEDINFAPVVARHGVTLVDDTTGFIEEARNTGGG